MFALMGKWIDDPLSERFVRLHARPPKRIEVRLSAVRTIPLSEGLFPAPDPVLSAGVQLYSDTYHQSGSFTIHAVFCSGLQV